MWNRGFIGRVIQAHPDWFLTAVEAQGEQTCEAIEAVLQARAEVDAVNQALVSVFGVDLAADKTVYDKVKEVISTAKTRAEAIKLAAVEAEKPVEDEPK